MEFCGHGTIATMYTMVKETHELMAKPVITAETNRKGIIEVFTAIKEEDAVYITAPDHRCHIPNYEADRYHQLRNSWCSL